MMEDIINSQNKLSEKINDLTIKKEEMPDQENNEEPKTNGVENVESEESDDSDESSLDDDEPIRAPLELLGEFLLYIRQGKWEDAKKLCVMILIYEPGNPEALKFQSMIDEKIEIEKELAELSGEETSSSEEEESSSEEDEEKESESDEDDDRTEHLQNKLLFSHDENHIWKP